MLFIPTKQAYWQKIYSDQGLETANDNSCEGLGYELLADNSSILSCHWIKVSEQINL